MARGCDWLILSLSPMVGAAKKSFSARMQRSFSTLAPFIYLPRWALRGEESEGLESPGEVLHVLRVRGGFKR